MPKMTQHKMIMLKIPMPMRFEIFIYSCSLQKAMIHKKKPKRKLGFSI